MKVNDLMGPKTPTVEQIAAKHKVSIADIQSQLDVGIKVEQEHTSDKKLADEIARDHLNEFPDYYDRLKRAEAE